MAAVCLLDAVYTITCSDGSRKSVGAGGAGGIPVSVSNGDGFSGATSGQAVRTNIAGHWPTALSFMLAGGGVSGEVGARVCGGVDGVGGFKQAICPWRVIGVKAGTSGEIVSTFDILCA